MNKKNTHEQQSMANIRTIFLVCSLKQLPPFENNLFVSIRYIYHVREYSCDYLWSSVHFHLLKWESINRAIAEVEGLN